MGPDEENLRSRAIQAGRRLVSRRERPLYRVKLEPMTQGRVRITIVEMPWLTEVRPNGRLWRDRAAELVAEALSCNVDEIMVAPF
jgi:hypothetical protein